MSTNYITVREKLTMLQHGNLVICFVKNGYN